ncbi:2-oxoglutarate-Fe(II) type oxidoreductase-like isoform X2 [Ananas comosus]|uniref:2-oxoglutarate-Fe(II) type oxidoreductase-like isoform X1 n=1 Tax=Ananas comosus TaxID=4615 RepID=A0A6P5EVQ4_ANACO|nr:2-oxoglutarate-Fe(II) type oxidoreductase-like isoform X1 [Ananas comosus]XP_020085215.1 2-oxoglutarate-Fe(II) type oxidoreductase-like isoform X2 [Ananas comosus]
MSRNLELPLVDLSSSDPFATAQLIRKACVEYGFFYLINHGIEDTLIWEVFRESKKFFALPPEEKMKLEHNDAHRGYTPIYAETLDPSSEFKGDLKESFYIGPNGGTSSGKDPNQWPLEESLPSWRATMESYYERVLAVGRRLLSLIAFALNLDDQFFEKIGALNSPMAFLRLLHYPGELGASDKGNYGASAHSDYGMVTLLATDGVPGLQICREKEKHPQLWEDVSHIDGALIVNIGDMLERWTNCIFRSTLHRVLVIGKERYSVAFFLDPNYDCVVECLESCCSKTSPPRFPPIRSGDYLRERLRVSYSSK